MSTSEESVADTLEAERENPPAEIVVNLEEYAIQCFNHGGDRKIIFSELYRKALSEYDSLPGTYFEDLSLEVRGGIVVLHPNGDYDQELQKASGQSFIRYYTDESSCKLTVTDCDSGVYISSIDSGVLCPIRFQVLDRLIGKFAPDIDECEQGLPEVDLWVSPGSINITYREV